MTSKPRRSLLANFSAAVSSTPSENSDVSMSDAPLPSPSLRVAAGVIGATQRTLSDMREENDRLRARLAEGTGAAGAIELDPELVEPSPYPDRLRDDDDRDFEAFRASFAKEGQQVPIQVRPHPKQSGRYQVIFGHRRWRAARALRLPVKALVRELTDRELAIAQGIENSERQDLTWIERALFASQMDEAGIKPRDIKGALSIDDAELARMRAVWRAIPHDVLSLIGRAPRVGRPRWADLASAVGQRSSALATIRQALSAAKVASISSDQRFQLALEALAKPPERRASDRLALTGGAGEQIGIATFAGQEVRLKIAKERAAEFAAFLRAELPDLLDRFARLKGQG